ncbi:MAG: CaiB/BaiF CoA transferase family protein, partial [Dehalococcoidia bacterium]
ENYSSRVMDQFGLGYPALHELNPRLVMVSLSGFGRSGPWRDYVSYALTVECIAGVVGVTGYAGGPPLMQAASIGDPLGGLNGGVAALMALYRRRRTGEGCHVDLSQTEAVTALLGDQLLDYTINGRVAAPRGNAHPSACPHGVYPCAGDDQWLALAVFDDMQWHAFCAAIEQPALADDPRFATLSARRANLGELDAIVAAWTRQHDKYAAMKTLQAAGVPAGAVQTPPEMLHDPQLHARGFWQDLERAYVGRHPHGGMGITVDGTPPALVRPAPTLGEHTAEVLTELLGLTYDDLDRLTAEQVIGTEPLG